MPTYEYQCEACHHAFEHFQSMSSRKLRTCPECKQKKLIRLVGAGAGVIFKGSGFYETDYKRSGAKSDSGAKSSESKASESKDSTSDSGKSTSGDSTSSGGSSDASS